MYYIDGNFNDAHTHAALATKRFPSAQRLLALIEEEPVAATGRM
jgi:hypothetical protein